MVVVEDRDYVAFCFNFNMDHIDDILKCSNHDEAINLGKRIGEKIMQKSQRL